MFTALKNGAFLRISLGSFLLTLAFMGQEVVLGYELYHITKDPLMLGLLGLAEALPFMALALYGGHLADRLNRRTQMLVMLIVMALAAVMLAKIAPTLQEEGATTRALWVIYGSVAVTGARVPAGRVSREISIPRRIAATNSAA